MRLNRLLLFRKIETGSNRKAPLGKRLFGFEVIPYTFVKNVVQDSLEKIIKYMRDREQYGESSFLSANTRLEHVTAVTLIRDGIKYHSSCRKEVVSSLKLARAKTRYEEALSSKSVGILSRAKGRPSTSESKNKTGLKQQQHHHHHYKHDGFHVHLQQILTKVCVSSVKPT